MTLLIVKNCSKNRVFTNNFCLAHNNQSWIFKSRWCQSQWLLWADFERDSPNTDLYKNASSKLETPAGLEAVVIYCCQWACSVSGLSLPFIFKIHLRYMFYWQIQVLLTAMVVAGASEVSVEVAAIIDLKIQLRHTSTQRKLVLHCKFNNFFWFYLWYFKFVYVWNYITHS